MPMYLVSYIIVRVYIHISDRNSCSFIQISLTGSWARIGIRQSHVIKLMYVPKTKSIELPLPHLSLLQCPPLPCSLMFSIKVQLVSILKRLHHHLFNHANKIYDFTGKIMYSKQFLQIQGETYHIVLLYSFFYMDASPPSLSDLCSSMSSLWLLSLSVELYRLMFGKARPSVTFHQAKRSSFFFDGKLLLPFCPLYTMSFSRLLFGKKSYSSRPAGDRSCSPQSSAYGAYSSSCSSLPSLYSVELHYGRSHCPIPRCQDSCLQRQRPHQNVEAGGWSDGWRRRLIRLGWRNKGGRAFALLPLSLNCYDFVPDGVPRDVQARCRALRLVDETFHKVLLALPAVGQHVVDVKVGKQLGLCVADSFCNRIERLLLNWTLLWRCVRHGAMNSAVQMIRLQGQTA